MHFLQDPPRTPDLFLADPPLRAELERRLPAELLERVRPRLEALGRATAEEMAQLGEAAEAELPVLEPYDPWGRRVDRVKTSAAWARLRELAAEHGIVATGYEDALGEHRRVVQCGLLHLYSASSATFSCPLAMTDAAARVLLDVAPDSVRERLLPRLLSRDPASFITSGQWMTERPGGSDVGRTETLARSIGVVEGEDRYALHGWKWFTSVVDADMALALGRIVSEGPEGEQTVPGSRGLTLFCVELQDDPQGGRQGIRVDRIKDKLGTRALPTAELTLEGCEATRLGPVGRGVPCIATMLNITRFYNSVAASSGMARAVALARDYAERREAFGARLADLPLHAWTLDCIAAETAAATALNFELAALLGRVETGAASEDEARRLRALVPLAKLTTGKQAVAVASEALECFGGAGYVEDTGLPRLLRDAQVLSIWEGTTNVLSLDLLRAQGKDGALGALLENASARAAALAGGGLPGEAVQATRAVLDRAGRTLADLAAEGDRRAMEAAARRLALATGYAVEAVLLGETALARPGDAEAARRFADFVALRLVAPLA